MIVIYESIAPEGKIEMHRAVVHTETWSLMSGDRQASYLLSRAGVDAECKIRQVQVIVSREVS